MLKRQKLRGMRLPNAELKVIKGEGHMLIFAREADDVNGLIEGFLRKQGY